MSIGTQRTSSRVTSSDLKANQPPTMKTDRGHAEQKALRPLRRRPPRDRVDAAQPSAGENRLVVCRAGSLVGLWSHPAER